MDSFENYKNRILEKASDEDVLNEIGYCYKRACSDMFNKDSYWTKCYYFLKGLVDHRKYRRVHPKACEDVREHER